MGVESLWKSELFLVTCVKIMCKCEDLVNCTCTPCLEKKEPTIYFGHNFDKFKHIGLFFCKKIMTVIRNC